jgi:hypothetical protein
MEDSEETRIALFNKNRLAYSLKYSCRYLGPGNMLMKFRNFNPLKDPKIEASQYEGSFPDVGKEEMEKRFSERRALFMDIYDRKRPTESLPRYMKAVQIKEGYKYKPEASAGPASLFLAGSVPAKHVRKGELPECQLLGFVDGKRTAGCMNSLDILSTDIPLAERIMYIALDTRLQQDRFAAQLQKARDHIEKCIEDLRSE